MTPIAASRPRVLMVAGYFDWFSGYQETALASALAPLAEVHVMASDRVSPAFSDAHLERLGLSRRYPAGSGTERGIKVSRLPSVELRSMVWSPRAIRQVREEKCDLIVQVMPGQVLSSAPAFTHNPARRAVLYGDNQAMWSHLNRVQRLAKGTAFAVSKGLLYAAVNRRADAVFGYTPDTQKRLRVFSAGRDIRLMPLCYAPADFYPDESARATGRADLGYGSNDLVILSAGKFDPHKRLEWLLAAFDRAARDDPRVHLLMVGDDQSAYSRSLRLVSRSLSAAERVRIEPFARTDQLNRLFNAADLGVWPRNPAITIQQAMATGLTVVLPRNDMITHLIRPGAGKTFDLKSGCEVERMTAALQSAIDDSSFGFHDRQLRAGINSWFSSDTVAHELLTQVLSAEFLHRTPTDLYDARRERTRTDLNKATEPSP